MTTQHTTTYFNVVYETDSEKSTAVKCSSQLRCAVIVNSALQWGLRNVHTREAVLVTSVHCEPKRHRRRTTFPLMVNGMTRTFYVRSPLRIAVSAHECGEFDDEEDVMCSSMPRVCSDPALQFFLDSVQQ